MASIMVPPQDRADLERLLARVQQLPARTAAQTATRAAILEKLGLYTTK